MEALSQGEERLRSLVRHAPVGIFETDAAGNFLFVNDHWCALAGMSPEAAQGEGWVAAVHSDDRERVVQQWHAAARSGSAFAAEFRFRRPDGNISWLQGSAVPLRNEFGAITGHVGTITDITARKQAEQEARFHAHLLDENIRDRQQSEATMRQNEERFRGLMEQAPFSVQVFDAEGRTLRVNRAWEELWGVTLEQIGDYNILRDAQLEAKGVLPLLRRAFAGDPVRIPAIEYDPNETIPNITRHRDPRRWTSAVAYPIKDAGGTVREVILVHEDITARRRAEQERERFAFVVQNSRDFIGMCDLNFMPFFLNREGMRLVGLTSMDEALRLPITDCFYPEDREAMVERFFPQVLRDGHGETEVRFRHFQTGQPIWMAFAVLVMKDRAGRPYGLATISRNIAERKRAEESLREADRLKDEFLAMLAHELRNPLAPLRNALHVMKQPAASAAMLQQLRDMAERQVQHMAKLLDDLLDVSRISRGRIELRKENCDLATILARTVEGVRPIVEERDHELTVALPTRPLRVEADATRLEQVMMNLLINAVKYTDPAGKIWLSAERDGSEAVLRVRDTGIGIAAAMLPRIFDLFVQAERRLERSQGGLGIGLTLVKRLVELHGGRVEAHSPGLGRGSEFVVRLPAAPDPAFSASVIGPGADLQHAAPARRVLVVDDNVDAADSLAMLLKLGGHEVRVAYDGPTALLVAQAFHPQIALLDIGMPTMDGYEVARRLREQPEPRPELIVAMTGWGQDTDRRRSSDAGFDHHLVKPVEPAALEKVLSGMLSPQ